MSSGGLTEEQKKRIEENRRKAIERRAALSAQRQQKSTVVNVSEDGGKFPPQNQTGRPAASGNSVFLPKPQRVSLPKQQAALKTHGYFENNNNHTGNFDAIADSQAQPSSDVSNSKAQNSLQSCPSSSSKSASSQTSFQNTISKFCRPPKSYSPTRKTENSTRISSHETSTRTSLTRAQTLLASSAGRTEGPAKSSKISALNTLSKHEKPVKGNCVLISRERFAVLVSYHTQLIGIFKTIPSKNYDAKTTNWNFLLVDYDRLMSAVKSLPPHVTVEGLPKAVISTFLKHTPGTLKDLSVTDINLNSIDGKLVRALMPFQKEGICFGIRHNGRVLIADDMGLGKTVQAICVACYYRIEWPLLVITPSSLRVTWQQAFLKWLPSLEPLDINVVLTGKDNPTTGLINIISYDLLSKHLDDIKQKQFRVIIADECHFIKNYKASRTQTALPLLKSATRVILLSGTPALSRPLELYTQICAIQPTLFPTFHQFGIRYCAGQQNYYGWDFSGASNMAELQLLLEEKLMIRRLKKDVLSQLPSKRRQMVMMDPSLIKTKTIERAAKQVSTAKQKEQHGALLNYFFETCAAKIPAVRNYILDLLESGRKFLVFAHHKGMLDSIGNCLRQKNFSFIRIDGNTPAASRQGLCDHFQQDKDCLVAVLSITAANTGLTLTEASAVVFAELFWNPGALVQAEDRVYRIGQKNSVNVHYLVAKGTADDYLWPLIQNKLEVLGKAGLSEEELDADCTFFQDPRQYTLFSCVESFIEKSKKDVSENATELLDNVASSSKENDDQCVSAETNRLEKQLEITAGSNSRKRTLSEEGSGNGTSVEKESGNKTFDWFEDLDEEDFLDCDLHDVMADCSRQIKTSSSDVSPPSAKRMR